MKLEVPESCQLALVRETHRDEIGFVDGMNNTVFSEKRIQLVGNLKAEVLDLLLR